MIPGNPLGRRLTDPRDTGEWWLQYPGSSCISPRGSQHMSSPSPSPSPSSPPPPPPPLPLPLPVLNYNGSWTKFPNFPAGKEEGENGFFYFDSIGSVFGHSMSELANHRILIFTPENVHLTLPQRRRCPSGCEKLGEVSAKSEASDKGRENGAGGG